MYIYKQKKISKIPMATPMLKIQMNQRLNSIDFTEYKNVAN